MTSFARHCVVRARSCVDSHGSRAVVRIVSHAAVLFHACRRVLFVSVACAARTSCRTRTLFVCVARRPRMVINCFYL
jgi:hypothetical protein